jgi:23S rRNA pseudouridine1911/1915/1917 synthase
LLDQLKIHLRSHRHVEPLVVHRIDRDTSGLVLFAKTHDAQRKLKEQFQRRQATRIYLALVYGCPKPDRGAWRDSLVWDRPELKPSQPRTAPHAAKEALCRYQVLENFPQAALIEVSLVSGKRNQIRIQASLRGHPLVGEKIYLYENAPPRSIEFPRQALHAHRLAFKHPVDGREMKFEAPPPEDFQKLLRKLR